MLTFMNIMLALTSNYELLLTCTPDNLVFKTSLESRKYGIIWWLGGLPDQSDALSA